MKIFTEIRVFSTEEDAMGNIIEEMISFLQGLVDMEGEFLLQIADIHLVYTHLPSHCTKSFAHIISLNPHNKSRR